MTRVKVLCHGVFLWLEMGPTSPKLTRRLISNLVSLYSILPSVLTQVVFHSFFFFPYLVHCNSGQTHINQGILYLFWSNWLMKMTESNEAVPIYSIHHRKTDCCPESTQIKQSPQICSRNDLNLSRAQSPLWLPWKWLWQGEQAYVSFGWR